jgi:hypothetical protein
MRSFETHPSRTATALGERNLHTKLTGIFNLRQLGKLRHPWVASDPKRLFKSQFTQ